MPRYRQYIDTDVLTEAKKRVHHIYDQYDNVAVMFSGGKDSLAVLHVTHEVAEERGIKKVKVVFRDEELIHQEIVDFVEHYRTNVPWVDLEWWCVPMTSVRYVLGETIDITFWDPSRPWARPMPDGAVTGADLGFKDGETVDQKHADALAARAMKGAICSLTGIRADESIQRYRACVNKLNENYIVASSTKRVKLGRPIFDWTENDVFRYFYDRGIKYCPIYDHQIWGGAKLRVSTALNPQASKVLGELEAYDPQLYERAIEVFPETALQRRYWDELDRDGTLDEYSKSWDTIREWVVGHYKDPVQRAETIKELDSVIVRARRSPEAYPLRYVLQSLMRQSGRRTVLPIKGEA